jgi:protein dithiol oxidoreductase (disulfide-forming)
VGHTAHDMNSTFRHILALGLLLLGCAVAQAQPRVMEAGKHYAAIQPAITTDAAADVIEILDVFWYGCPVCREFEPMMTYYGGEIRGDLTLRRMPAVWNPLMAVHARLYYTIEALGIAGQAHPAAFRHLQEEGHGLSDASEAGAFLANFGVGAEAFEAAWDSPQVLAAVARAQRDTAAAGIEKLPALVLNGRYRVTRNAQVPELTEMIIINNELIKTLRDERRID